MMNQARFRHQSARPRPIHRSVRGPLVALLAVFVLASACSSDNPGATAPSGDDAATAAPVAEGAGGPGEIVSCTPAEGNFVDVTVRNTSDANPIDLDVTFADSAGTELTELYSIVRLLQPGQTETRRIETLSTPADCVATIDGWNSYAPLSLPVADASCSLIDGPSVEVSALNDGSETTTLFVSFQLMDAGERIASGSNPISDVPAGTSGTASISLDGFLLNLPGITSIDGLTCEVLEVTSF